MTAPFQGFLFDLDGTLLDTFGDLSATANLLYQRHNLPPISPQVLRPLAGDGVVAFLEQRFPINQAHDSTLKQEFIDIYLQQFGQQTYYFSGIEKLLNYMLEQQIPWGIVTNKPGYLMEMTIKRFPLLGKAGTVVAGDTLSRSKPFPEPVQYACRQLNCQPKHCLFIGDHERDVISGRTAGTYTAIAAYGYVPEHISLADWKADYILNDVEQIYQLVVNSYAHV